MLLIMKKLLFVLLIVLLSSSSFAQSVIDIKRDIVGYWQPDQESTQLFFWINNYEDVECQEISETSGKPLNTIFVKIIEKSIIVKTEFVDNNWIVESTYTFLDSNTLKCTMTGDTDGIIIYKRKK